MLNEAYATRIARDSNDKASGVGHVTRLEGDKDYLDGHKVHQFGGQTTLKHWTLASELEELNRHIVDLIEVVGEFR